MADNTSSHSAAHYDQGVRQTIPYYDRFHAETIDLVRCVCPEVTCWLDTGCGTGALVAAALPFFPQTHFYLTDPSQAMLEQASHRLSIVDADSIHFLPPMPSQDLGACQGKFHPQVISAIQCHHYLQPPQRREAIQACYDLLAPGGILVCFENIAPDSPEGLRTGLDRWGRYQVSQGRTPEAAADHRKRYGKDYFPIPIHEHIDLLKQTGFHSVEILWASYLQAGFYALKSA